MQGLAGDVFGLIAGEKQHRIGNILHIAQAAERGLRFKESALLFGQGARHVGVDKARRHAIDGDAAAAHFARQLFGKTD